MSLDATDPQEEATMKQKSKAAVSSDASCPKMSSEMDIPAQLDACLQFTFLLALDANIRQCAVRFLCTIREGVIGCNIMTKYIDEGYSAEMLGTILDDTKSIKRAMIEKEGEIRDLALGYAVVQIATQYDVVTLRDEPSVDAVRLSRLQKIANEIKTQTTSDFVFPTIDYTAVYAHIEDQKINGNLAGDPAWELEETRRKTLGWRDSLQINMRRLDLAFQELAQEIDWNEVRSKDGMVAQSVAASGLIVTLLKTYEETSVRMISGPLQHGCNSSQLDVKSFCRVGKQFRSGLLQLHKRNANQAFQKGQYDQAEISYKNAIEAGSNDPSHPLNRAAALLKLGRYKEAIISCTLALMQLEICGKEDTLASVNGVAKITPSERTERVCLSSEEISNLQWKAHIRRGRAQKALLEKILYTEKSKQSNEINRKHLDDLLRLAKADFTTALQIDSKDDTAKQELALLALLQSDTKGKEGINDLNTGIASINIIIS